MRLKIFLFGLMVFITIQSAVLLLAGASIGVVGLCALATLVIGQVLLVLLVFAMVLLEKRRLRPTDTSDLGEVSEQGDVTPPSQQLTK